MAQLLSFKSLQQEQLDDECGGERPSSVPLHHQSTNALHNEQLSQIKANLSLHNITNTSSNNESQQKDQSDTTQPQPPMAPPVISDTINGAAQQQLSRPTSPIVGARGAAKVNNKFDAISNVSKSSLSGVRSPFESPTRHFELRWRNVDLRTKSKRNVFSDILGRNNKLSSTCYSDNDSQSLSNHTDGTRQILTNLSGTLFSGQLTAILGPSGVGKTTLLNCFTGHNTLEGTGRVSVIGGLSKRIAVCTIPQEDILPQQLTVKEDLYFTSQIKNPHQGFDHNKNVARVTRLLQIDKCFETRISKLSGGETRRLSIARELLSNPDLMILDEPTSGLDANTCWKIINALKSLVEQSDLELDRPIAMIVTIHQPQRELLNLFHRIYVMAQGGHCIFEGPPSSLLSVIVDQCDLLKKAHLSSLHELNENPAVVAIEVASGEYGQEVINDLADYHTQQLMEQMPYFAGDDLLGAGTPRSLRQPRPSPLSVSPRFRAWHHYEHTHTNINSNSPQAMLQQAQQQALQQQLDYASAVTFFSSVSDKADDLSPHYGKVKVDRRLRRGAVLKSHFWRHTLTLIRRSMKLIHRNLFLMSVRIIGFILVAGGIVQIYHDSLKKDANLCPNYSSQIEDVGQFLSDSLLRITDHTVEHLTQARSTHTFFFHSILCIMMVTSALTGLIFPLQMRMFLRERKNGWYSLGSFLMSNTLAEMPTDILGPIITMIIVYPLCHQPDSYLYWRFFAYTFTCTLACLICKSQAQIIGAFLIDSVENSVFASCVMVAPQALLSGIAVRVADMYYPMQLLSYVTFLRYAFDSLFILRYGFGLCPCDSTQVAGYPAHPSDDAVPIQLENLANGLIDLSSAAAAAATNATATTAEYVMDSAADTPQLGLTNNPRFFNVIVDLVSGANNMFVPNGQQLGACDTYRSLYLVERNQKDSDLIPWLAIMMSMFVVSRFITYYILLFVMRYQKQL